MRTIKTSSIRTQGLNAEQILNEMGFFKKTFGSALGMVKHIKATVPDEETQKIMIARGLAEGNTIYVLKQPK